MRCPRWESTSWTQGFAKSQQGLQGCSICSRKSLGTAAPVFPEQKNRTPATSQPRLTQENLKVQPGLQAGITAPGQLRSSKALLRRCYVRALQHTSPWGFPARKAAPAAAHSLQGVQGSGCTANPRHGHLWASHFVIQHLVTRTQREHPFSYCQAQCICLNDRKEIYKLTLFCFCSCCRALSHSLVHRNTLPFYTTSTATFWSSDYSGSGTTQQEKGKTWHLYNTRL